MKEGEVRGMYPIERMTVLVLGAAGYIGSCMAANLIKDNASVIAVDLNMSQMKANISSQLESSDKLKKIQYLELDVNNEEDIRKFFSTIGRIDGAINCAYPRNKQYGSKLFDTGLESFNENVNLHLGSYFCFLRECARYFVINKYPISIINFSSIYGVVAPKFEIYHDTDMTMPVEYAAIKSAIQHLTKYVVKYVGDSSFRVNCVSPGGILNNQPEAFQEAYKANTLGSGMLMREDLYGTIYFLLSTASKHINGQNLIIDDGFTL